MCKSKRILITVLTIIFCISISGCSYQEYKKEQGMKKNADNEFLSKIETSILERIETISDDTFDRATVVNAELFHLESFAEKKFYDEELKELANKYIEGLNIQKEALGKDLEYEYQIDWQKGIVMRYEVLNKLHEEYGFLKDNSQFVATYVSGLAEQQKLLKAYETIEKDLSSQNTKDMTWEFDGVNITHTFKNNTEYSFSSIWEITYYDANNTIVGTESTYVENIKAGNSYLVSFFVPNPEKVDHYSWHNYYAEVK